MLIKQKKYYSTWLSKGSKKNDNAVFLRQFFKITPSPNQGGGGELFYSQIIVGSSDRHCLERALVGSSVLSDNELGLAISVEAVRRLQDVSKPPK